MRRPLKELFVRRDPKIVLRGARAGWVPRGHPYEQIEAAARALHHARLPRIRVTQVQHNFDGMSHVRLGRSKEGDPEKAAGFLREELERAGFRIADGHENVGSGVVRLEIRDHGGILRVFHGELFPPEGRNEEAESYLGSGGPRQFGDH